MKNRCFGPAERKLLMEMRREQWAALERGRKRSDLGF